MSVSNNKIIAPVSITDDKQVLKYSTNDLGTLCIDERNRINKWSVCKPVRSATVSPDYNDLFFRNADGLIYGMQVTERNDNEDAFDMYQYDESEKLNWKYIHPSANGNEKDSSGNIVGTLFRLGDFKGYYHNAQQLCASDKFVKGQIDYIDVGQSIKETEYVRFYVSGTSNNDSVNFSKLSLEPTYKLVLCANVFDSNFILKNEYINNNIKLRSYTEVSDLSGLSHDGYSFDDDANRWKFVDVKFDQNTYFNTGTINELHVFLTLDYVIYDAAICQWRSDKKIIIPYSDDNYYRKQITITRRTRSIQPQEIQVGINGDNTLRWQSILSPVSSMSWIVSPRIKFTVSKTTSSIKFVPMTGDNKGYFLMAKNVKNGKVVLGSLYPSSAVTIGTGTGTEEIICDFGGLFDDYDATTKTFEADLYLVNNSSGGMNASNIESYASRLDNQKILITRV